MRIELRLGRAFAGAAVTAGCLVSPLLSRPAHACGGFWCSRATPVNQAAEEILFVDNPDDTVTAIIQISYVGPSQKFAWVIPIPGKPTIGISSDIAFQRLDAVTAPQYTREIKVEGTCKPSLVFENGDFGAPQAASAADAGAATKSSVTVIDSGSVGPYDYDTIEVDPALAQPADAAIKWFGDHGYDLTGVDADLLGPYLADGLHLLAFKLTKSAQTGSIRPVMLTYESELPMIPLRPTAVAAQDDMGVLVWVAAVDQAVPQNYKSLVINDALINWFNFQQNYRDVVTAAANEAGGQGFVTELAGPSNLYKDAMITQGEIDGLAMIKSQSYADGLDAITAANAYFRDWDGWRDAIMDATTLPAGVTFDQFGRSPESYRGQAKVDVAKFFADIEDNVLKPVTETQRLFNTRPYVTRLFSTMSADEMTVDPAFAYNSDLANVSNKHVAKEFIECSPDLTEDEAPWRIELPQGGVISGKGSRGWPIEQGALPANLKIVQLSTSGTGKVVTDNSGAIGTMLFEAMGTKPSMAAVPSMPTGGMIGGVQMVTMKPTPAGASAGSGAATTATDTSMRTKTSSGGCAITGAPASGWSVAQQPRFLSFGFSLVASLLALLGVRVRRRAR